MLQKTESSRLLWLVAWTGMLGPVLLATLLVVLTVVQYDFMRSLRWQPLVPIDWPSGLALGPYGGWMTAGFVGGGLVLMLFARGVRQLFGQRVAPLLFFISGIAMLMLCFPTDPTYRTTPMTIHGVLHDAAYGLLGITFLPGMILLARKFKHLPAWHGYARLTWWAVAIIVPSFILKGVGMYIFLLTLLAWYEMIALKIWKLTK